jgi:UDP-3-O-[3-hydroxymyristoyl] glucosamine N-acyltransferase
VAGSTRIGSNCKIGGAAIINGHIDICDNVMLGGGTGIYRSITEPGLYSGANLPLPHAEWQRVQVALPKLPELQRRLRRLEREVEKASRSNDIANNGEDRGGDGS